MNYILHFFFTIQYNIGFRNKRNAYINLFPFNTGDCLIEVTTLASLIVFSSYCLFKGVRIKKYYCIIY